MPTLKINDPRPLDPKLGLPWHAAVHTLTLCEQHLTNNTWNMLYDDPGAIENATGCGVLVYNRSTVDFSAMNKNGTIAKLPKDLQDCIIFAAANGFSRLKFELFDPLDCPLIEHLPAYPRSYNPNPKINTLLFPPDNIK